MWRLGLFWAACFASVSAAQAQEAFSVNWSGLHVSGLVGASRADSDAGVTSVSPNYFTNQDFWQFPRDGSVDMAKWRGNGSLQAGYSRQFGNVVLGLDASADALMLDKDQTVSFVPLSSPLVTSTIRHEIKADWMAALRPRLGWAQGRWHVYGTGGPAITRLKVTGTYSDTVFAGGVLGASGRNTTTETKVGWIAGVGGEYAIDQNWALNMQLLHTDFGHVRNSTYVTHTGNGQSGEMRTEADLRVSSVMLGLTYRFTGF